MKTIASFFLKLAVREVGKANGSHARSITRGTRRRVRWIFVPKTVLHVNGIIPFLIIRNSVLIVIESQSFPWPNVTSNLRRRAKLISSVFGVDEHVVHSAK